MFDKPVYEYSVMMFITIVFYLTLVRLLCWLPKRKKIRGGSKGTGFLREKEHSTESLIKRKTKKAKQTKQTKATKSKNNKANKNAKRQKTQNKRELLQPAISRP